MCLQNVIYDLFALWCVLCQQERRFPSLKVIKKALMAKEPACSKKSPVPPKHSVVWHCYCSLPRCYSEVSFEFSRLPDVVSRGESGSLLGETSLSSSSSTSCSFCSSTGAVLLVSNAPMGAVIRIAKNPMVNTISP